MKQITIKDFMTDEMVDKAIHLYRTSHSRHLALVGLLKPHMADINRKLGQENDVDYLAYAVEYAISVAEDGRHKVTYPPLPPERNPYED